MMMYNNFFHNFNMMQEFVKGGVVKWKAAEHNRRFVYAFFFKLVSLKYNWVLKVSIYK
jgi:hypothetical protein